MNERIRQLRKELKLSQTEFGGRLGIKQTTVAGYETGGRTPIDAVVSLICREFNVNEEWLRTGEGDMFKKLNRQQEIAKFTAELFRSEKESFKSRFILALAELDENEWKLLEDIANKIANKKD